MPSSSSEARRRAVVLLSGGLDSATTLALALAQGFAPHALTFRYGQRHANELAAADRVAAALRVAEHLVVELDTRLFGGSALTRDIPVPKARTREQIQQGVPITYVPARNTVFLAHALAWAETLDASHIFLGINAVDYSGYPDCRPQYIEAFERMAGLATRRGAEGSEPISIHAPLLHMSKAEIIANGLRLGVDYGLTRSCYDPSPEDEACGECDACQLRIAGFQANGVTDPIRYSTTR